MSGLRFRMTVPRANRFLAAINAEKKPGQIARSVFQVFGMVRPGIEPLFQV